MSRSNLEELYVGLQGCTACNWTKKLTGNEPPVLLPSELQCWFLRALRQTAACGVRIGNYLPTLRAAATPATSIALSCHSSAGCVTIWSASVFTHHTAAGGQCRSV
jgi:hypothetical protein